MWVNCCRHARGPVHALPKHALPKSTCMPNMQSEATRHFYERVEQCKPLWSSLQRACR